MIQKKFSHDQSQNLVKTAFLSHCQRDGLEELVSHLVLVRLDISGKKSQVILLEKAP